MARSARSKNARERAPQKGNGGQPPRHASAEATRDEDIRVFLSYARVDDKAFNMVEPFKELLELFVHLKTGRRITTFLDQRSILWGQIWRERLEEEVLGASVFIPLVTTSYLESANCRMEFNRFYSTSRSIGVSELLLPVLVMDAPAVFRSDSQDDLVATVLSHQYEVIEDAVLSDPGSAEWKRTMARLAERFAQAYAEAEDKLEDMSPLASPNVQVHKDEDDDTDAPGLTELLVELSGEITLLTDAAQSLGPALNDFGASVQGEAMPSNAGPRDLQLWSYRLASAVAQPAEEVNRQGQRLFEATLSLDETVSGLRRLADSVPGLEAQTEAMLGEFGNLQTVRDQMSALLESMRPAEAVSVPLRKALRPARTGVTKVNDSLALIDSWRQSPLGGDDA